MSVPFDSCPGCGVPVGPPGPSYPGIAPLTPLAVTFACGRCGYLWPPRPPVGETVPFTPPKLTITLTRDEAEDALDCIEEADSEFGLLPPAQALRDKLKAFVYDERHKVLYRCSYTGCQHEERAFPNIMWWCPTHRHPHRMLEVQS